MPIGHITTVAPTGDAPYESNYGPLHSFNVTFSDGTKGKFNAKTPDSRWKVGDSVMYTVNKELGGGVKSVKIEPVDGWIKGQGKAQTAHLGDAPKAYSSAPLPEGKYDGAAVGNAITNSLSALTHNKRIEPGLITAETILSESYENLVKAFLQVGAKFKA